MAENNIDIVIRIKKVIDDGIKKAVKVIKGFGSDAKKELSKANIEFKQLSKWDLAPKANRNEKAFRDFARSLDYVGDEANEMKRDLREASKAMDKMTASASKAAAVNKKGIMPSIGTAGITRLAGTAAAGFGVSEVTRFANESTKMAASFEYEMAKVNTIARKSSDELAIMGDAVEVLAVKYGRSADDVAGALFDIFSSVGDTGRNLDILDSSLKASVAGFVDVRTSSQFVTTAMNAMGLSAEESERVFGAMFKALEVGKGEFRDYANAVNKFLPSGKATGQTLEDMLGGFASLSKQFATTEEAATSFRSTLDDIASVDFQDRLTLFDETKDVKVIDEATGKFRSYIDVLGDVNKALDGLSEGRRAQVIQTLFPSEEARRSLNIILNDFDGFVNNVKPLAGDLRAAFQGAFTGMADTAAEEIKRAREELLQAQRELGETFLPIKVEGTKILIDDLRILQGLWKGLTSTELDVFAFVGDEAAKVRTKAVDAFRAIREEQNKLIIEAKQYRLVGPQEEAAFKKFQQAVKKLRADQEKALDSVMSDTSLTPRHAAQLINVINENFKTGFKELDFTALLQDRINAVKKLNVDNILSDVEQALKDINEAQAKDLIDPKEKDSIEDVKKRLLEMKDQLDGIGKTRIDFSKILETGNVFQKFSNMFEAIRRDAKSTADAVAGELSQMDALGGVRSKLAVSASGDGSAGAAGAANKNVEAAKQLNAYEQANLNIERQRINGRLEGVRLAQLELREMQNALQTLQNSGAEEELILHVKDQIWRAEKDINNELERQSQAQDTITNQIQKQREEWEVVDRVQKESLQEMEDKRREMAENEKRRQEESRQRFLDNQREMKDTFITNKEIELKQLELSMGFEKDEVELLKKQLENTDAIIKMLKEKRQLGGDEIATQQEILDLEIERLDILQQIKDESKTGLDIAKETYDEGYKRVLQEQAVARAIGEEYDIAQALADLYRDVVSELSSGELASGEGMIWTGNYKKAIEEVKSGELSDELRKESERAAAEMQSTLASAIKTGMTEGANAGIDSFIQAIQNKMLDQLANDIAGAMMGGMKVAGDEGGGGATGEQTRNAGVKTLTDLYFREGTGAGTKRGSGGGMWGALVGGASDGGGKKSGGFFDEILGGLGAGGGLGGAMPWLMGLSLVSGLFKKGPAPQQSGVQPIGGGGPNIIGGDFQSLYGSDVFKRASFSARNAGGDLTRKFAGARMGESTKVEVELKGEAGDMFQVKNVSKSNSNSSRGVPSRTGFGSG